MSYVENSEKKIIPTSRSVQPHIRGNQDFKTTGDTETLIDACVVVHELPESLFSKELLMLVEIKFPELQVQVGCVRELEGMQLLDTSVALPGAVVTGRNSYSLGELQQFVAMWDLST